MYATAAPFAALTASEEDGVFRTHWTHGVTIDGYSERSKGHASGYETSFGSRHISTSTYD